MFRAKSWIVVAGIVSIVWISGAFAGDLVIKTPARMVKGAKAPTVGIKTTKLALPFNDTCENAFPGNWAPYDTPYFAPTTYKKYAGTRSYYCAQGGTGSVAAPGPYPPNFQGWITYGPFSLAGMASGRVRFKLWNASGPGDRVFAGWSLNDISYEGFEWTGNSGGWIDAEADMSGYDLAYLGQSSVYFSFYYYADASGSAEGAYVDNISITANAAPVMTGGIQGSVVNGAGVAIKGALITAGTHTAYSNLNGKYSMNLPAGTYTVKASRPGYTFAPTSASVTVGATMVSRKFTGTPRTGDGIVKRWAVSVGIANYQSVNDLNYCDDDARDVSAVLKAGGFPAVNVRELIDSQGTKAGIRSAIQWMVAQADADDICVFFHSGHGGRGVDVAPLDEATGYDEYLVPHDATSSSSSEISDDELGQWFAPMKTTKYVVMIDTCYAGGMIKGAGFGASLARSLNGMSGPAEMQTKDLDDVASGVVITSCTDIELSEESGTLQNGVFAYYLVRGIFTGDADINANGWISAEEIFKYSRNRVHTYNPDQTLMLFDACPGELSLAKVKVTAPASTSALVVTGTAAASASGATAITVDVSAAATVSATICNLAGRAVATLAPQDVRAGVSTLLWNGKSSLGTKVPAGQYLVKLQAHDASGNMANCLLSLRK